MGFGCGERRNLIQTHGIFPCDYWAIGRRHQIHLQNNVSGTTEFIFDGHRDFTDGRVTPIDFHKSTRVFPVDATTRNTPSIRSRCIVLVDLILLSLCILTQIHLSFDRFNWGKGLHINQYVLVYEFGWTGIVIGFKSHTIRNRRAQIAVWGPTECRRNRLSRTVQLRKSGFGTFVPIGSGKYISVCLKGNHILGIL